MKKRILFFEDLGYKKYKETWIYQKILFNKLIHQKKICDKKIHGYLLFVEHPHVYTIGKNGKEQNLLVTSNFLKKINAEFYQIDRGGDITYHGPGQLVVYPILNMDYFFTDIHKYLRFLEEVVIHFLLKNYGIKGERINKNTGVWLIKNGTYRKICSIGIRISRWITMHGFSLNINTDLRYFDHIIPCGLFNKGVTSLKEELKNKISFYDAKNLVKKSFQKIFHIEFI
ncbi:lipoyl(octanoyl) transferase LipB [Blattabacterium cuenoti]|uniref:lipoyl(octanoyl) transferase LipB n=1 Tax=Blattabacterium cuenoti TaxID=1653831 RepID=UPI00163C1C16|nr:lipoyl(octanoyl) transferase LipB [Blattabacterium cuenoti]